MLKEESSTSFPWNRLTVVSDQEGVLHSWFVPKLKDKREENYTVFQKLKDHYTMLYSCAHWWAQWSQGSPLGEFGCDAVVQTLETRKCFLRAFLAEACSEAGQFEAQVGRKKEEYQSTERNMHFKVWHWANCRSSLCAAACHRLSSLVFGGSLPPLRSWAFVL